MTIKKNKSTSRILVVTARNFSEMWQQRGKEFATKG